MQRFLSIILLVFALAPVSAELKLPHIFSKGMVLQQERGSQIWGWTQAGAEVSVTFAGQEQKTQADDKGAWQLSLSGLKANATGQDLVIQSGDHRRVIPDVLVGEVWLASGQSNMEWRVQNTEGGEEESAGANDPLLRVFVSQNIAKRAPQRNWWGEWKTTAPKQTKHFPAVGYYFGKKLRAELNVPVGIIECAWGGRPVEAFTSEEALKALPEAKNLLDRKAQKIAAWDPKAAHDRFQKQKADYDAKFAEWKKTKKGQRPNGPRKPVDPSENSNYASTIYNGMIAPLVGYGVRGVIWYQGESNANEASARNYQELLGCLVADWRKRWGYEMPFYWAQLANFKKPTDRPGTEDHWVIVQDEMRRALQSIPHGGMAVTNDIGAANDIHPRNKKSVGNRLARWALRQDYQKKSVIPSGPLYAGSEFQKGKAILTFSHGGGLRSRDGQPLKRFEIAGPDGKWHWGKAMIDGGKIIVTAEEVPDPKKVRYAWAANPQGANLVNGEGLPASCFTTE